MNERDSLYSVWVGKPNQYLAIEMAALKEGFEPIDGSEEYKKIVEDDVAWYMDEDRNEIILRPNRSDLIICSSHGAIPIVADALGGLDSLRLATDDDVE